MVEKFYANEGRDENIVIQREFIFNVPTVNSYNPVVAIY